MGECFANHCDYCGVIQGNHYLFEEDSVLSPNCFTESELVENLGKLKIFLIGIDENLVLDWDLKYGSNDEFYIKYALTEEIILSDAGEDDFITYKELYGL